METTLTRHAGTPLLEQGHTVESIALDLGYASATAFINLFKRWMVYP